MALKHNLFVDRIRLCLDRMRIEYAAPHAIVLVHAMPKTGGTSVHHSLNAQLQNVVFHIHTWDAAVAQKSRLHFQEKRGGAPYHLRQGEMLRRTLDEGGRRDWKIVTLVREPVARLVSLFFQTGERVQERFLDHDGNYRLDEIAKHLTNKIAHMTSRANSREEEWFEREILRPTGIDVFKHDFDHEAGYRTVHHNRIGLLAIRLEDLNRCFSDAATGFLNLSSPVTLRTANSADQKDYAFDYREVRKRLRFPEALLREIYSDKFVQHFYSDEMIERFVNKWVRD